MIEITTFEKAVELRKPRRIRKYVLLWSSSGEATLVVGENAFELRVDTVITKVAWISVAVCVAV
ncbi:MAG: hypothetical protein H0X08_05940 [Blastocatellia bacterium]|nr:hypothetical protein [Blastocatellia bacterium]